MENRQDTVLEKVVEQVFVIVLKVAIESVPVVGPIFCALSFVSDVQRVKKALQ
jgi:hypothetical protein